VGERSRGVLDQPAHEGQPQTRERVVTLVCARGFERGARGIGVRRPGVAPGRLAGLGCARPGYRH